MLRTGERAHTGIITVHPRHRSDYVARVIAETIGILSPRIMEEYDLTSDQFPTVYRIEGVVGAEGEELVTLTSIVLRKEHGNLNDFHPGRKGFRGRYQVSVGDEIYLPKVEKAEAILRIPPPKAPTPMARFAKLIDTGYKRFFGSGQWVDMP